MITISAFVGRDEVVRWPRRVFDGSLSQNDFVELDVGRLACPDDRSLTVISMFSCEC